jgi:hypothetical protein
MRLKNPMEKPPWCSYQVKIKEALKIEEIKHNKLETSVIVLIHSNVTYL